MRLKSRDKFIPGEFQAIHPEAGQKTPWKGSFNEIVKLEHDFRQKNPALVKKNGWSLDPEDIANDIDISNAQRMVAAGYFGFVELEGEPEKKTSLTGRLLQSAASAVGKAKTALAIYKDLFGATGKVVPREEAERRAASCVACPLNDTAGGLKAYFVKEAAQELMLLFGILKDMDVNTSLDDKLGVCKACSCPMRSKVHIEGAVLKKNMPPEDIAKLHPSCWIPGAIA